MLEITALRPGRQNYFGILLTQVYDSMSHWKEIALKLYLSGLLILAFLICDRAIFASVPIEQAIAACFSNGLAIAGTDDRGHKLNWFYSKLYKSYFADLGKNIPIDRRFFRFAPGLSKPVSYMPYPGFTGELQDFDSAIALPDNGNMVFVLGTNDRFYGEDGGGRILSYGRGTNMNIVSRAEALAAVGFLVPQSGTVNVSNAPTIKRSFTANLPANVAAGVPIDHVFDDCPYYSDINAYWNKKTDRYEYANGDPAPYPKNLPRPEDFKSREDWMTSPHGEGMRNRMLGNVYHPSRIYPNAVGPWNNTSGQYRITDSDGWVAESGGKLYKLPDNYSPQGYANSYGGYYKQADSTYVDYGPVRPGRVTPEQR
jgi:hypothetical protein